MSMENSGSAVDRLRDVRERLLEAGTVVARADGRRREVFPVAIGRTEGLALLDWVRNEGAQRTLESGLGFAVSTLFLCEGLLSNGPDGRHVAADPYQFVEGPTRGTTYAGVGVQVLEEAGVLDLVVFYPEESQVVFHGSSAREGSSISPSSTETTGSRRCSLMSSTPVGS